MNQAAVTLENLPGFALNVTTETLTATEAP
jgi:hypothetical protein